MTSRTVGLAVCSVVALATVVVLAAGFAGSVAVADTDEHNDTLVVDSLVEPASDDEPIYDAEIVGTNDPVIAGQTLRVDARIENVNNISGDATVSFAFDGSRQETKVEHIEQNDSETLSFYYDTPGELDDEYRVEILTDNTVAEDTVEVYDPLDFDLEVDLDEPDAIESGETLVLEPEIENTGTVVGADTIRLEVRNDSDELFGTDEAFVSLEPGETETPRLTWESDVFDSGTFFITVGGYQNQVNQVVEVEQRGVFAVEIDNVSTPALSGETLTVDALVENVGEATDDDEVVLEVDGEPVDRVAVDDLDDGETDLVSLEWEIEDGHTGSHELTVLTRDDTGSESVTVVDPVPSADETDDEDEDELEPAAVAVEIDDTNTPLEEGETAEVNATLVNVDGDAIDEATLEVGNETVDNATFDSLEPGESESVTLKWETTVGDAGNATLAVRAGDGSASERVTVEADTDAVLDLELESLTNPVDRGETVEAVVTVENTGSENATRGVTLATDDETVDDVSVENLPPDESESVTLEWQTGVGDTGTHDLEIATTDDSLSETVTVTQPVHFDVSLESVDTAVTAGESVTANATIENVGEQLASETTRLEIDGEPVDRVNSSALEPGEREHALLEWESDDGDVGEHSLSVNTTHNAVSESLLVGDSSNAVFAASLESPPSLVTENETVTVNASVENIGTEAGDGAAILEAETNRVDGVDITDLEPGENESISFTWEPTTAGTDELRVRTADDDARTVVVVDSLASTTFTFDDVSAPQTVARNETLTLEATIRNSGSERGSGGVSLAVANDTVDGVDVGPLNGTDDGTEAETVTLAYNTSERTHGQYPLSIETPDRNVSETVYITERGVIDVAITETTNPDNSSDPLEVTATLTNIGSETTAQPISFGVDNESVTNRTVDLDPGETATETFAFEEPTEGQQNVSVASENVTATETVDVEFISFEVRIDETNAPIEEDDTLTVNATVINRLTDTETTTLEAELTANVTDSQTLSLEPGETAVTFDLDTSPLEADTYTLTLSSADDETSEQLEIESPPSSAPAAPPGPTPPDDDDDPTDTDDEHEAEAAIDLELLDLDRELTANETFTFNASVTNTGNASTTAAIDVLVNDSHVSTEELSVDASEQTTITVSAVAPDTEGNVSVTLGEETYDAHANATVSVVVPEPTFELTDLEIPTDAEPGETVEGSVRVLNDDSVSGTQTVTYAVDGELFLSQPVTLEPGESETIVFSGTVPDDLAEGTRVSQTVTVGDSSTTTQLQVTADDSLPGFGVVGAAVALVSVLVLARVGANN